MSLFNPEDGPPAGAPLADRLRPLDLDEFVGQLRVVGPGTLLRRAIEQDDLHSLILWGPPGSGKTTLARIVARRTRAAFVPFSAVLSGIKEVREVMRRAESHRRATGRRTIIFVDEIHRFNKAQQDAFLPFVEKGTVVLVGATAENPSFEVNSALLSRCRVYRLEPLSREELLTLLQRALQDPERGLGQVRAKVPHHLLRALADRAHGDARIALNVLELAVSAAPIDAARVKIVSRRLLEDALQQQTSRYDKTGEEHFNVTSALHKSMRNSDPDAALYWLARMLDAGEDPLYVARRIVRFASEDVGLADPDALRLAVVAKEAVHFVGRPEADLALAEATVYCALAPKSNALQSAWSRLSETIREGATEPVPLHLRNAPTNLMKSEGYGRGYLDPHDHPHGVTVMQCLPPSLLGRRFYEPTERGFEKELRRRLERFRAARRGSASIEPRRRGKRESRP